MAAEEVMSEVKVVALYEFGHPLAMPSGWALVAERSAYQERSRTSVVNPLFITLPKLLILAILNLAGKAFSRTM
jgi:hypothetical protein